MVPVPELRPEVLPTDRLTASGKPIPELRVELRRISDVGNAWSVFALWASTIAIVVGGIWLGPVGWVLAFLLMGPQFARFASLGHEAAHRLLFNNKRINDWVGRWVLGYPSFFPVDLYRRGHMAHHRDEFGPDEPDMAFYYGYPVAPEVLRRRLKRDAWGNSGWKNLKGLVRGLSMESVRPSSRRIIGAQVVLLALCAALGYPLVWPLLWLAPWMTSWRVINRLRSIAEHGGMQRSSDRRATTHAVAQSRMAGFILVPYNIGYHLAHHVDMGIPWRNLPAMDAELRAAGYEPDGLVYPSYRALWRALCSPASDSTAPAAEAPAPAAATSPSPSPPAPADRPDRG